MSDATLDRFKAEDFDAGGEWDDFVLVWNAARALPAIAAELHAFLADQDAFNEALERWSEREVGAAFDFDRRTVAAILRMHRGDGTADQALAAIADARRYYADMLKRDTRKPQSNPAT